MKMSRASLWTRLGFTIFLYSSPILLGQWSDLGGPPGGNIEILARDPQNPQTIYAGTNTSFFKSVDGGFVWNELDALPNGQPFALAVKPGDSSVLYAAIRSNGLLRSDDGGESWTNLFGGINFAKFLLTDAQNPEVLYLAGNIPGSAPVDTVHKSTDGGQNWSRADSGFPAGFLNRGGTVTGLVMNPEDPADLFAAITWTIGSTQMHALVKTTDGGASWTSSDTGLPSSERSGPMAIDPNDPAILYATVSNEIYLSTDAAGSWQSPSDSPSSNWRDLAVNPENSDVYIAGTTGVFKSTDTGDHWSDTQLGLETHALEVAPAVLAAGNNIASGATIFAGSIGAGVFRSTDDGQSWSNPSRGISAEASALTFDPFDPTTLLAGTTGGLVFRSTGGGPWFPVGSVVAAGSTVSALVFDPNDSSTIYAGVSLVLGPGGVFKLNEEKTNWTAFNNGLPDRPRVKALVMDPFDPLQLFAGVGNEGVFRSSDGGENWEAANTGLTNTRIESLLIDPDNPNTLLAGSGNGVFISFNQGDTWTAAAGFPSNVVITDIVNVPGTRTFYAGSFNPGIFQSGDGGENWSPAREERAIPGSQVAAGRRPPLVFGSGSSGSLMMLEPDWIDLSFGNPDLPLFNARDLLVVPTIPPALVLASFSDGVWQLPFRSTAATLGQAIAGPVGEEIATTNVIITNRVPPRRGIVTRSFLPKAAGLETCEAMVRFSRGATAGVPVRINGEPTSAVTVSIPEGGASRLTLESDGLAQGVLSITTSLPCLPDSLSVSGNYLIRSPVGELLEAFTIRPNTAESWLVNDRCHAVSTVQDPTGSNGLGQNMGLAVSSVVPGDQFPDGTEVDLSFFNDSGSAIGTTSIPFDGTHRAVFPFPDELEGTVTAVFCLDTDPEFRRALDMTIVKVFSSRGFQFGSALLADTFQVDDPSAWNELGQPAAVVPTGETPPIPVVSLGQSFAGPVGEGIAVTNVTITNRDQQACPVEVTFSQGVTLGPPVLLNGQGGNSIGLEIPRGGVGQVVMAAEELAVGILTITTSEPCDAGSLSVSGNYLVTDLAQAIKEAFTIRPNPAGFWPNGSCNVITTFQDPSGETGLVQNLGLALSSTDPGQPVVCDTNVDLILHDARGDLISQAALSVDGTHSASFPLPEELRGLVTTLFCLSTDGNIDMTAIKLFQQGVFQFGSALLVDNFVDGAASAWNRP